MTWTINIPIKYIVGAIACISWFIGSVIMVRNYNGDFKHDSTMGLVSWFLVVQIPILLFGGIYEGWFD